MVEPSGLGMETVETLGVADRLLLRLGIRVGLLVIDGRLIRRFGPVARWRLHHLGLAATVEALGRRRRRLPPMRRHRMRPPVELFLDCCSRP
jgi:hypothetical protein